MDRWEELKRKWGRKREEKKFNKKSFFLLIVFIFILILSILFYHILSRPTIKIDEFISSISNSKLISGRLDTSELGENSCYWLKTMGRGFEIWQIKNTTNCTSGMLQNITRYDTDYPVLISGKDCICGKDYPVVRIGVKNITNTNFLEVKIE